VPPRKESAAATTRIRQASRSPSQPGGHVPRPERVMATSLPPTTAARSMTAADEHRVDPPSVRTPTARRPSPIVEDREHGMGGVGPGSGKPRARSRRRRSGTGGERRVHQLRRAPRRSTPGHWADLVLHGGQIGVQVPQQGADERQQNPAVHEAVASATGPTGAALTATKRPTPPASRPAGCPRARRRPARPCGAGTDPQMATSLPSTTGRQDVGVGQAGHRDHLERRMAHPKRPGPAPPPSPCWPASSAWRTTCPLDPAGRPEDGQPHDASRASGWPRNRSPKTDAGPSA